MQKTALLLLAGFTFASVPYAHAGVSEDFAGCDGLKKPKKKDDGIRGVATIKSFNNYALFTGSRKSPLLTIERCNRALSSDKLRPTQTLRKAHLLRARAAARLLMQQTEKALTDIDAADAAVADRAGNVFFDRSMGTSLKLLRAMAYSNSGRIAEADQLAIEAADARPYALQVQFAAAMIRHGARPFGKVSPSPWSGLAKLSPENNLQAIEREADIGNFAAIADIADKVEINWPDRLFSQYSLMARNGPGAEFFRSALLSANIAYAKAVVGDADSARQHLAIIHSKFETAKKQIAEGTASDKLLANTLKTRMDSGNTILDKAQAALSDRYGSLVEARIALSENRFDDAKSLIKNKNLPQNAAKAELMQAFMQASPEMAATYEKDLVALKSKLNEQRRNDAGKIADMMLIAPEASRSVIDYKKSRPKIMSAILGGALSLGTSLLGGINRSDGFKSTRNEDGTTRIEFVGKTTSGPMVQEMTLLRAAEMAKASGKKFFKIVKREDYTRYMVTKQYGIEQSRVPTGYQTKLDVIFLDSSSEEPNAIDALKVLDHLGPLYYDA